MPLDGRDSSVGSRFMDAEQARQFLAGHHRAILQTYRRDGSTQMSPIAVSVDDRGRAVVSSRETAFKTKNVRRDPRVSICVVTNDWYGPWIQIDGRAEVISLPEAMEHLIDYYRSVAGEHPDWDEYRRAMESEQRVLIAVEIERAGPDRSG